MNDRDFALVVGINLYPGIGPLQGAQLDAEEFAKWLQSPDGGDLPDGNVHTLLTSQFHPPMPARPAHASPTENLFEDEFLQLLIDPATSRPYTPPRRRLYLYLSGHGFSGSYEGMNEAALYAANAHSPSYRHIAATRYAEWAKAAAAYEEIVLIMDCCRDMSLTRVINSLMLDKVQNPAGAVAVRKLAWYAVPAGAKARERQIEANGPIRGVFTYLLLEALRKATPDKQGQVTGQAVANYIQTRWPDLANKELPPELPVDTARDLVFATHQPALEDLPHTTETRVKFELSPPVAGDSSILLTNGRIEVAHIPLADSHAEWSLPAGLYKAQLQGQPRQQLFEVAGEEVHVTL